MSSARLVIAALLACLWPASAFAVNANPTPGSVWTYFGPTYGADWSPVPPSVLNGITPEAYGAKGNGTDDDTSAIVNACAAANSATRAVFFTQTYRIMSSQIFTCDWVFISGANLNTNSGVTATHTGKTSAAPADWIYRGIGTVVETNAAYVSVAWWGGLVAADAVPAFRSAVGSNRKIICPPGNYTFNSVRSTRPYTTLNYTSVYVTGQSNFEWDCEGANILPGAGLLASVPGGGAYGLFQIDGNSTDFSVHGFRFPGDYHSNSLQNSAFTTFGAQRFTYRDINFSGNWGGVANAFVGDWMVDGTFTNLKMPQIGICFDFGYVVHVHFDNIFAAGSDGAGGPGYKCLSIVNDTPNAGTNPTPVTIVDTIGVDFSNSDISNFGYSGYGYAPVVLVAGTGYRFHGNRWHNNPGNAAQGASVAVLFYANSGPFSSVGTPVRGVVFDGDIFDGNGTAGPLPVIAVNGSAITNSDVMGGYIVSGCIFANNNVGPPGSTTANIFTQGLTGMTQPAWSGGGNYFGASPEGLETDPNTMYLGLVPGFKQMISGNSGNWAAAGSALFVWSGPGNASENVVKGLVPYDGYFRALQLYAVTPPGAGQSITGTFRIGGVSQPVTCTISGTANTCNSAITGALAWAVAASNIDVQLTSTAGAAATQVFWAIESDSYD